MKKIIAELFQLPNGAYLPQFYCLKEDGQPDPAISSTLLELIADSHGTSGEELKALIDQAEAGRYVPQDPSLPDWSVNDKNVWLISPMAELGHVCISNENNGDYSVSDGGQAQQFSYEQFRTALSHWESFKARMKASGMDSLVGQRYETDLY